MPGYVLRGARLAAPLAAVAVMTACSSGSGHPPAAAPVTTPVATTASPADAAATTALHRAEQALAAVRSYRFDALETVAAAKPVTTRVAGAVVRGQGVFYTLTVGSSRSQVVRMRAGTYVRHLPGRWSRLHRPRAASDPTASLVAVLRGLTGVRFAAPGVVTGLLPSAAATAAGIPTSGGPAQVSLTLDAQRHVTRLAVVTATTAAARRVAVTLITSYSGFGHVPALRAPV